MKYPLLTVCLAFMVFPAMAQSTPPSPKVLPQQFVRADMNDDGKISKKELAKFRSYEKFQKLDMNGDGKVTEVEFGKASGLPNAAEVMQYIDKNKDQVISPKELDKTYMYHSGFLPYYDAYDTDGDGWIDPQEFNQDLDGTQGLGFYGTRF
ncbi:MAG: hypothetical protein SFY92_01430 [Verrucomicrobiae bacterium]|nr:hypothetical protein [Verrucomicrobiae bacterium]